MGGSTVGGKGNEGVSGRPPRRVGARGGGEAAVSGQTHQSVRVGVGVGGGVAVSGSVLQGELQYLSRRFGSGFCVQQDDQDGSDDASGATGEWVAVLCCTYLVAVLRCAY